MSIDFEYHCQQKNEELLDFCFGGIGYRAFLTQLAVDAGIGELWKGYDLACQERLDGWCLISRELNPEPRPMIRKRGKKMRPAPVIQVDDHPTIRELNAKELKARQAVQKILHQYPIVEFLLMDSRRGLNEESCQLVGPRFREIAERWEPAKEGFVGWREKALEMCEAMELVVKYPPGGFYLWW